MKTEPSHLRAEAEPDQVDLLERKLGQHQKPHEPCNVATDARPILHRVHVPGQRGEGAPVHQHHIVVVGGEQRILHLFAAFARPARRPLGKAVQIDDERIGAVQVGRPEVLLVRHEQGVTGVGVLAACGWGCLETD
uniref:Uncharacterized protein n=1 Tax=Anopheles coluzzii TaxID=1518534 RepID=A0A8W7P1I1_ANOCL